MIIKNKILLSVVVIFLLSGCARNVNKVGATELYNYNEKSIREKIIIGKSTKKDVLLLLGKPLEPDNYNGINDWVYISKVMERRLILLIPINNDKNQILKLSFDNDNIVRKIYYIE
ncbi:outer membrane protein assembly factor BamE [Serratia proteamaculans]|uniref:outer membrane protein assembly factor BamE domain-containing protein n=1 Tax=Serratia proteamaculans TaxID=28151 RepID=UPI000EC8CBF4|nr:hypothetical protein [Serratia sp. (in: enterobacteria)]